MWYRKTIKSKQIPSGYHSEILYVTGNQKVSVMRTDIRDVAYIIFTKLSTANQLLEHMKCQTQLRYNRSGRMFTHPNPVAAYSTHYTLRQQILADID